METIADILREVDDRAAAMPDAYSGLAEYLSQVRDRIEAAHKREILVERKLADDHLAAKDAGTERLRRRLYAAMDALLNIRAKANTLNLETSNETVDDILAEARRINPHNEWADRIEAAHYAALYEKGRGVAAAGNRVLKDTIRLAGVIIGRERRRLKVAEDALERCVNAMCNYCRSTPEAKGLPCLNGCETLAIAKNALAAIREGDANGNVKFSSYTSDGGAPAPQILEGQENG